MQRQCTHVSWAGTAVILVTALVGLPVPALTDTTVATSKTAALANSARQTEVSIQGDMFFINGRPTYEGRNWRGHKVEGLLMNARLVQGIFDDLNPRTRDRWAYPDTGQWDAERNTREFVAAMPSWREHGLISFTINLQGGSPEGYSREQPWHNSALGADGSLRLAYMRRLERMLDRADELGMVPLVGIYYFGQDDRLTDEAAVIRGVQNVVNWVLEKGYRNVLIEINNECNVRYDHPILQPERVHELITLAKGITRDGRRLYVSTSYGGGTVPQENVVQVADFVLVHGNGVRDPKRMEEMIRQVRAFDAYRGQPIVNNEDDRPWWDAHQGWGDEGNNFVVCVQNHASWGYFDFRIEDEGFDEGLQSVPVNWQISSERKRAFFDLMSRITGVGAGDAARIRPTSENPFYWQYEGEPVLLLGGSWQDNLFNHPMGLERHLELMQSVGGNAVRNVMSHRNAGNVFAYQQVDGKFDLDRWNDEYWRRFENFLKLTHERDIIVQIEIWATWDHYEDHQSLGGWSKHPFNPANNVTYTAEESGLPTQVSYAPRGEPTEHPFFRSVPELANNELVLRYQRAFVDKLLSYSLPYPQVLYCMNNETGEHVAWGDYWAHYVRRRAQEAGAEVSITDMRRSEDVRSKDHAHIFDRPDLYTFVDISQNNAWTGLGQKHYDHILYVRDYLAQEPRPINNNKNYGAARHGEEESVARFCRIVFASGAGVRLHRPHPLEDPAAHEAATEFGLGLSPRAQAVIASMREIAKALDFVRMEPRNDLLSDREPNEAYCLAEPGKQYAVYFPDDGQVQLDVSAAKGNQEVRWLDIGRSAWHEPQTVPAGLSVELMAPVKGHQVALLLAETPDRGVH